MVPCWCRADIPTCPSAFAPDENPVQDEASPVPHAHGSIISLVVFPAPRGEQAEAILDGEGTWRCPKRPVLDRVLNALYEPGRDATGDLPFGHAELVRVAAWLRGEVRLRR